MKYFVFIITVTTFLVAIVGCKKDEENKVYHNSGTLYDKDGTTPLANEELILQGTDRDPWSFSAGEVARTTTDYQGFFSFEYTQTNYSHFHIASPKTGHLLTHGNVNRDFSRDVCIEKKALVTLIVNIERQMNANDTIYIDGPPPQTALKRIPPKFSKATVAVYPDISESFVIHKIEHPWNGEGKDTRAIQWSVGWADFLKCYDPNVDANFLKKHWFHYEYRGFPYVDTVKVTIE